MEYRVEDKYIVTDAQLRLIAARLRGLMPLDPHQKGDCYEIRSLYFDDAWDRCMDENNSGVDQRQKFRIRTYDPDAETLHLEIKAKLRGLTKKVSCNVSREEVCSILSRDLPLQPDSRKPMNQLKMEMRCCRMEPKAIISYERTAFVHPVGNVRITFDRNITACKYCEDFWEDRIQAQVPVLPTGVHVLEVKYDELLPDFIARQLEIGSLRHTSFSKYYLGRLALLGQFPADY